MKGCTIVEHPFLFNKPTQRNPITLLRLLMIGLCCLKPTGRLFFGTYRGEQRGDLSGQSLGFLKVRLTIESDGLQLILISGYFPQGFFLG